MCLKISQYQKNIYNTFSKNKFFYLKSTLISSIGLMGIASALTSVSKTFPEKSIVLNILTQITFGAGMLMFFSSAIGLGCLDQKIEVKVKTDEKDVLLIHYGKV